MKRSIYALLLILGCASPAWASLDEEWARALEIPCHPLLTDSECRVHRDKIARLGEGEARKAYLVEYFALVRERMKSCGCVRAQTGVGLRRYR